MLSVNYSPNMFSSMKSTPVQIIGDLYYGNNNKTTQIDCEICNCADELVDQTIVDIYYGNNLTTTVRCSKHPVKITVAMCEICGSTDNIYVWVLPDPYSYGHLPSVRCADHPKDVECGFISHMYDSTYDDPFLGIAKPLCDWCWWLIHPDTLPCFDCHKILDQSKKIGLDYWPDSILKPGISRERKDFYLCMRCLRNRNGNRCSNYYFDSYKEILLYFDIWGKYNKDQHELIRDAKYYLNEGFIFNNQHLIK